MGGARIVARFVTCVAVLSSTITIVAAGCDDPKPATDCTDNNAVCISLDPNRIPQYIGPELYLCAHAETSTDECGHTGRGTPTYTCCSLKRCGEGGRGYCRGPCAPDKTMGETDPACAKPDPYGSVFPDASPAFAPCCATISGK